MGSSSEVTGSSDDTTRPCLRGHWRPAEDDKLRQLVLQYGPHNWNSIAQNLQGRSGKSCRLRWFNQLDPAIKKSPFTEEEEERLLEAHRMHGSKWSLIARLFPGRTDNAVKNHWHVIKARRSRRREWTMINSKITAVHQYLHHELHFETQKVVIFKFGAGSSSSSNNTDVTGRAQDEPIQAPPPPPPPLPPMLSSALPRLRAEFFDTNNRDSTAAPTSELNSRTFQSCAHQDGEFREAAHDRCESCGSYGDAVMNPSNKMQEDEGSSRRNDQVLFIDFMGVG